MSFLLGVTSYTFVGYITIKVGYYLLHDTMDGQFKEASTDLTLNGGSYRESYQNSLRWEFKLS